MWNTTSPGAFVPYLASPIPIQSKYGPINVRLPRQAAASSPKQEDGNGIRGSDVLWALQRATAKKKKAKTKKDLASSEAKAKTKDLASSEATGTGTATHKEKDIIDYTNVRPLEIKSEWSLKLDELEKRLQDLEQQDTT